MKTGIIEASTSRAVKDPMNLDIGKRRVIFISPVVEVVNVDHEGEVGEGYQHEGGDEAGGDVVAWLPHKVDDHLRVVFSLSMFLNKRNLPTFLVSLFPPASTMV